MKTLRTIEGTHSKWEHEGNLADFTYDLQQEAIKHYKAQMGEYIEHRDESWAQHYWNVAKWIQHFFNLTEEDLK